MYLVALNGLSQAFDQAEVRRRKRTPDLIIGIVAINQCNCFNFINYDIHVKATGSACPLIETQADRDFFDTHIKMIFYTFFLKPIMFCVMAEETTESLILLHLTWVRFTCDEEVDDDDQFSNVMNDTV